MISHGGSKLKIGIHLELLRIAAGNLRKKMKKTKVWT